MAQIVIYDNILDVLINHTLIDPYNECGGFLYGIFNNYQAIVNGIYYEKYKGKEDSFIFNSIYQCRAKLYTSNFKSMFKDERLLGTYHSHAKYEAIYSNVDRKLETFFVNGICLIYSPSYNQLAGDIIKSDYIISSKIKVINSNGQECVNSHNPKIMSTGKAIKLV